MFLLFAGTAWTSARKGKAIMPTAKMFTDNMVLQRGRAVPVWGWAEPGTTVSVEFAGQCESAVAGADRRWMARLDPMDVGREGRVMRIRSRSGSDETVLQNILVGDVWLGVFAGVEWRQRMDASGIGCAGQGPESACSCHSAARGGGRIAVFERCVRAGRIALAGITLPIRIDTPGRDRGARNVERRR